MGLFYRPKEQISLPFHILQLASDSLPFHIPEARRRYPFRAKPPRIGVIESTPPSPPPRGWSKRLPEPFTIVALWGTRNLIYILVFILLWLLLRILILRLPTLLLYSILTLPTGTSIYSSGFYSQSWTCFGLALDCGGNKIWRACVMFWYYWALYVVCYRQEATSQWKTKTLVNKPKQELQRD